MAIGDRIFPDGQAGDLHTLRAAPERGAALTQRGRPLNGPDAAAHRVTKMRGTRHGNAALSRRLCKDALAHVDPSVPFADFTPSP